MDNTFNILEKYVDEHMDEILDILRKEYLSKLAKVEDILIGKATTTYVVKNMADILTQQESENARCGKMSVDKNEHIWYNKFSKWSWNKFENGVIKIDERRI